MSAGEAGRTAAIEVVGLRKAYGGVEAVRGIDLTVQHGEVFALLGPNGAGKTTTVEILEGFRPRSGGAVTVLGEDPGDGSRRLRSRIGVVLQTTGIDPYLTVGEVIDLYRGYYDSPRPADELLSLVGLTDQSGQRVKRLSGGQQRRLDVAVGLAGDPDLLFLDEPTTGFDPGARRQAWEMIAGLKALGKTVLLTTHYMQEAEALADRVAVLARGVVVAEGSPDGLAGGETGTCISVGGPAAPPAMSAAARNRDGDWEVIVEDPVPVLAEMTSWASTGGHALPGLSVRRRSLEDVYLDLTTDVTDGESAPDGGGVIDAEGGAPVRGRRRKGRRP